MVRPHAPSTPQRCERSGGEEESRREAQ